MFKKIIGLFGFNPSEPKQKSPGVTWKAGWTEYLATTVHFYKLLSEVDKRQFEKRCLAFINTTRIEAGNFEVTDEDRLLIAASAVIPVWSFPKWHYFNLDAVFLMPNAFNENFVCGQPDSHLIGMVGTGPMAGKMALSRPHLHLGFQNHRDKRNVGIHEFVHLVDMMDGICDGMPERLDKFMSIALWFDFVDKNIAKICDGESSIDQYGATNYQEFFAVASEYFFERPRMLQKKHPVLYEHLSKFYRQNMKAIMNEVRTGSKDPCPCGSGKRYKHCCLPE